MQILLICFISSISFLFLKSKIRLFNNKYGQNDEVRISKLDQVPSNDEIDPVEELKLLKALIMSSETLKHGPQDLDDLSSISNVTHKLIVSKQRSQKVLIEQDQLVAVGDIIKFLDWIEELLIQNIGSDEAYSLIDKMKTFKITE